MTLSVRWATGAGIGIDLIKERRTIREVEESREGVKWTRASNQIVIVLLLTKFATKRPCVIAHKGPERVAHLHCVFCEDSRCRLGPRRSKSDTIEWEIFNFYSRYPKV